MYGFSYSETSPFVFVCFFKLFFTLRWLVCFGCLMQVYPNRGGTFFWTSPESCLSLGRRNEEGEFPELTCAFCFQVLLFLCPRFFVNPGPLGVQVLWLQVGGIEGLAPRIVAHKRFEMLCSALVILCAATIGRLAGRLSLVQCGRDVREEKGEVKGMGCLPTSFTVLASYLKQGSNSISHFI